jgi:biopolymer transport protein ExbB/TolQ
MPPDAVHDFSMQALFWQADPVVRGIMLLLLGASVLSWAVILDRSLRVMRLARAVRVVRLNAGPLDGFVPRGARLLTALMEAGRGEWRDQPVGGESRAEQRERIERAMRAAAAAELHRIEPGLPFLATVGSAAPFIGLLGTVWGIMNSFNSIAQARDTSLAVVAPGIAEALFATALGLVAAIPAVVGYNKLATALARAAQRLDASIADIVTATMRASGQSGAPASWR